MTECGASHLMDHPETVRAIRQRLSDSGSNNARRALIRPWVNFAPKSPNRYKAVRPLYGFQDTPGAVVTRVCKRAFLELVDNFVSPSQIRTMMQKEFRGLDTVKDQRGGAYRMVPPDAYDVVRDFISSCPEKDRHYTMNTDRRNKDIKVLSPECIQSNLWKQFKVLSWMTTHQAALGKLPVSQSWFYQKLRTFSYHRGQYAVDQCHKCTDLLERIDGIRPARLASDSAAGRQARQLKKKWEARKASHLKRAYNAIDVEEAARKICLAQVFQLVLPCRPCSFDGTLHVRTDMGSNLDTPRVPGGGTAHWNSVSYTIVLWFVDSSRGNKVTVFIWESREGEGGPRSMISALMYYLLRWNTGNKRLVVWADNTRKGTKCWAWLHFMDYLCNEGWFESAELRYYVKGHTFMGGTGPDALHSILKRGTPKGTLLTTVKDWIQVAKEAGKSGKWEVVHLVEKLHRNWKMFLLTTLYKQSPGSFSLDDFAWFGFGKGQNKSGEIVDHLGVVWARHSHSPQRRFQRIKIRRQKWGKFNPDTFIMPDIDDPLYDMGPNPLKKSACAGIIKCMPMMSGNACDIWKDILINRLGRQEYYKQRATAFLNDDDACSTDSGEDTEERDRKWAEKERKKTQYRLDNNIRLPGYRADYAGVRRMAPVDPVSKERRDKAKKIKEEKDEWKAIEKQRRARDARVARIAAAREVEVELAERV